MVIITSYPTRANGIIVLVNSQFYFHNFTKRPERKFFNLAHYFPYDVKLRLLAHSLSFLANQKARNAIVRAQNLLKYINNSFEIGLMSWYFSVRTRPLGQSSHMVCTELVMLGHELHSGTLKQTKGIPTGPV